MIETRHVEANGLRFACLEAGEGPLVLCVHGFPDTAESFRPLLADLARAGFHAVAPFTRGHAPTESPGTKKIRLEELAADLVALVSALGHERAAMLVGHDWGAAASYLAAGTAPERFDRLVGVGLPHPHAIRPSLGLAWHARHFVTLVMPWAAWSMRRNDFALVDTLYRRWSPTWAFGPEETAAVKRCFADPSSLDASLAYYRGRRGGRIPGMPRKITVPTVAVAGADDIVPVSTYEEASRFFEDYRVVALPGGHFVHRESPAAFQELVLAELPTSRETHRALT